MLANVIEKNSDRPEGGRAGGDESVVTLAC